MIGSIILWIISILFNLLIIITIIVLAVKLAKTKALLKSCTNPQMGYGPYNKQNYMQPINNAPVANTNLTS